MNVMDRGLSVSYLLEPIKAYLQDDDVTEVCIQRETECWTESAGRWQHHAVDMDYKHLQSICTAVASYNASDVSDVSPILSAILPDGCRIQIVMPPASNGVSITIRKPSRGAMSLDDYTPAFYNGKTTAAELTDAVQDNRTIVVCGETSSGKTTLLKSLIQLIPHEQRIITIEDVAELTLDSHPNHVNLFYGDGVTASDCLKSCLRQRPDRIILGECRSGETFDFINVCSSGHGGSLSSLHAGSCALAFDRLAMMCLMAEQGRALTIEPVERMIAAVVDIVVHVTKGPQGRYIADVWRKS